MNGIGPLIDGSPLTFTLLCTIVLITSVSNRSLEVYYDDDNDDTISVHWHIERSNKPHSVEMKSRRYLLLLLHSAHYRRDVTSVGCKVT